MEHALLIGEETVIPLRQSHPSTIIVSEPGTMQVYLNPEQVSAGKGVQFSSDNLPGIYTVMARNDVLEKFAVNIDPDESNTVPSDANRRENLLRRLGSTPACIHTIDQVQDVPRAITESRLGAELWKQFLAAALIIAVIEMFVGREKILFPVQE